MKLAVFFLYRLRWIHLPGAFLMALLQRTPALRVVATAEQLVAGSPLGAVLRSAFVGMASLGAVHAVAGATQFVFSPRNPPYTGTAGTAFSSIAFTVTGALTPAGSYRITNLPPGLTVSGVNANGVLNASTGVITGTPTTAGTYTTTIRAYEFNNAQGDAFGPASLTFVISNGQAVAPSFTQQPVAQSVNVGGSVTFTATATGSPLPAYQWFKNSTAILGATTSSLVISGAQPSDDADYYVTAANNSATVQSSTVHLSVNAPDGGGRLTNLSVRTALAANQLLTVGVVVGNGSRDILVRAAGPALAAFNLTGVMVDPSLELFRGQTSVFVNDNWPASLAPVFSSVGAFPFGANSRDAAFVQKLDAAYSIQARGTGAGVVLVEAYDTGPETAARLVNVSARNRVGTGDDILIAGFTIANGSKRLLLRAIGPKLTSFGVTGVLADPKLEIYNSSGVKVAENDNWTASLASTFSAVGAFDLDTNSRDAALVTTLAPGGYTAQVSGVNGGTGEALIEIYEAP